MVGVLDVAPDGTDVEQGVDQVARGQVVAPLEVGCHRHVDCGGDLPQLGEAASRSRLPSDPPRVAAMATLDVATAGLPAATTARAPAASHTLTSSSGRPIW